MSQGKGSTPRPIGDRAQYAANWERTFGAKPGAVDTPTPHPDLAALLRHEMQRWAEAHKQRMADYRAAGWLD